MGSQVLPLPACFEGCCLADEAILTLSQPRNTREEVAAYRELVERRGWQRVGLITSGFHLRRAMRLADAAGLEVVALPAESRGPPAWEGLMSVIPSGAGFYRVHRASWEVLGAAVGR